MGSVHSHAPDPPFRDPVEQLRYWMGVVRRHWFVMGFVWALVMFIAVLLLASWPRSYLSTAKFLVRNARQELVVNPGDSSAGMYRDVVSEETLNSEIELLRSRDLLERVVRELELNTPGEPGEDEGAVRKAIRRLVGKVVPEPPSANEGQFLNIVRHLVEVVLPSEAPYEDDSLVLERAVRKVSDGLEVGAIRKTNFIRLTYESNDPEQAATILRHLADTYLDVHLSVHSNPGTVEFFKEQAAISRDKWEKAQDELTALARRADLVTPDDQRRAAVAAANEMENQLATLEAEINQQSSRVTSARIQLQTVDSRIRTQERKMPNQQSVQSLHTLVTELKNKRTQLLTKFNATDRLVLEVDEQLANTEAALKEASALRATEEASDLNPSWQVLQNELMNGRLALAGLKSKAERLTSQLAAYRARAITLNRAVPEYEALSRGVVEARTEYERYVKRAEEARIAEALDKEQISNVVLAEAPVATHFPSSPRVKLGLLAGAIAATVIALAIAILLDWIRGGAGVQPQRRHVGHPVRRRVLDLEAEEHA